MRRAAMRLVLAMSLGLAAGCDYVAQKELVAGTSTRADVERLMGKPRMVWDEDDGRVLMEYPRGPAGHETWMVELDREGRYVGMRNLLTEANFAKVAPGLSRDEVRRLLGAPTEQVTFERKREVVWSWRFMADQNRSTFFNVHFGTDGTVRGTSRSPDPARMEGG